MRRADVFVHGRHAGILTEMPGNCYRFSYDNDYTGPPVSLTLPLSTRIFEFEDFPPFFDGLLPEGMMLDSLIRQLKIDRSDRFAQLCAVGADLVGTVTVEPAS